MTTHGFLNKDQFILGTFASNCSSGMTVSKLPNRWDGSWESNLRLAKLLDQAGIEFMLPIARWIGYGGETDFHNSVLEATVWATALLAHTKQLHVFSTVHTVANHPVVAAKQIATAAQMSNNRIGLNVVAGWNKPEYEALGLTLPEDHETRYGYAEEWFSIVKKIWSHEGRFDWDGQYFQLKNAYGNPRPDQLPPIFNAAGSGLGREFATRNANFLFTPAIDLERSKDEIAEIKQQAKDKGRELGVLTFSHIICRSTQEEAERDWQKLQDNADWEAVDNLIRLQFAHAESFPHDLLALIRERFAAGHGGYPIVGTPEQVADGLTQLHNIGFSGTTLSFFNYADEFPYFRDHVLPILEQRGIRRKPA